MNSCFQISCLACTAYQHVSECCLSFTAVFWASELHAQVPPRRDRCVTFVVRRVRQGVLEFFSGVENRARAARRGGEQARLVQPDVVDVVATSKNGSCSRCLGAVGGPESFERAPTVHKACRRRVQERAEG